MSRQWNPMCKKKRTLLEPPSLQPESKYSHVHIHRVNHSNSLKNCKHMSELHFQWKVLSGVVNYCIGGNRFQKHTKLLDDIATRIVFTVRVDILYIYQRAESTSHLSGTVCMMSLVRDHKSFISCGRQGFRHSF